MNEAFEAIELEVVSFDNVDIVTESDPFLGERD